MKNLQGLIVGLVVGAMLTAGVFLWDGPSPDAVVDIVGTPEEIAAAKDWLIDHYKGCLHYCQMENDSLRGLWLRSVDTIDALNRKLVVCNTANNGFVFQVDSMFTALDSWVRLRMEIYPRRDSLAWHAQFDGHEWWGFLDSLRRK